MAKKPLFISFYLLIIFSLILSGCQTSSMTPKVQSTLSPTKSIEADTEAALARRSTAPPLFRENGVGQVNQELSINGFRQTRLSSPDTPFVTTGRRLYVIGDIDGGFRPRTNPYDLATFGGPRADDPLGSELGGVWAQPVKALDGYVFVVEVNDERWPLIDGDRFTQTFANVEFNYHKHDLIAARLDFVPQDRPVLFSTLTLLNSGDQPLSVRITLYIYFDLEDAWLTSLADTRNSGETLIQANGRLIATANSAPETWAVAAGGEKPPEKVQIINGLDDLSVGQLEYTANLEPGAEQSWTFGFAVETEFGPDAALRNLDEWLPQHEMLLTEKLAIYDSLLTSGPRFHSSDRNFDAAFDIARANAQMLEAESAPLGGYFYAGLETFPYWFCNDMGYSSSGLIAAGFSSTVANHLRIGADQAKEYAGQVPHQLSPAGSLIAIGNAQETSQFVSAVWDYYRWTGDIYFLAEIYPVLIKGIFDYTLDRADKDGDRYPEGGGMVERAGMGPEKLDSASYLWSALNNLTQMAEVLGDKNIANRTQTEANALQASFDADWWLPEEEVYANSLLRFKSRPSYGGHWTVAVPLEVGFAPVDHAQISLERIRRDYINEWGLMHTRGKDERVWTLPTATLSRGAYRYGNSEMGWEMLQHLAQTLDYGSIGLFHELIPDGLTSLQLWSGATFVRGVVEDLMGITIRTDLQSIAISPQLPDEWNFAELENLHFGEYIITVHATHDSITVTHTSGPLPLSVTYHASNGRETSFDLNPGDADIVYYSPINIMEP